MLAVMRAFGKTWYAKGLFVVLILSFGLIFGTKSQGGFDGLFQSDNVIDAGSRSVSSNEFKKIFDRYKKGLEAERNQGQAIPIDEFVKFVNPQDVAEELASQRALNAWLDNIGVKPSDKLIAAKLAEVSRFQNPVTGQFDKSQYEKALAEIGATVPEFQREQSDNLGFAHFAQGIQAGVRVPRAYAAFEAAFMGETRDASYFVVDAKVAGAPGKPTDAQLQAFLNEHVEQLRHPEFRVATAALFIPTEVAKSIVPDQDKVKKVFDFRKEALSKPETRSWSKVIAPNAQAAAAIAQAMQKGVDVQAAAKASGGTVVPNQDRPKAAEGDQIVAQAVFSMQPGQVSQPIKGQLGWAVVKLDAIKPGREATLEEARPEIEAQLKTEEAKGKLDDMIQKFEEARTKGATLEAAAAASGAQLQPLGALNKDGRTPDGKQAPKVVADTLFGLIKGATSEVTDAGGGDGSYFAVRADQVIPAAAPTIQGERELLTQLWTRSEQQKMIQAKASDLVARIKKGETLQAVAASAGAKVVTATDLKKTAGQGADPITPYAFGHALGESFSTPAPTGFLVGKVDAVHPVAVAVAASQAAQMRPQILASLMGDMERSIKTGTRAATHTKVNKDKITSALGLTAPVGGAPKKK